MRVISFARLNRQHRDILQLIDNELIIAPVQLKAGDEVLDCATGTGIWLVECAAKLAAQGVEISCTGVDVSPHLFPPSPEPNITFLQHSVLALPSEFTSRFTLINQRLLLGALRLTEWPLALREHFRVLRPGGWIQLCEIRSKGIQDIGPRSKRMAEWNAAMLENRGMDPDAGLHLKMWAEEAGFVNVQTMEKGMPLGKGEPYAQTLEETFVGMKVHSSGENAFNVGVSEEEYDHWLKDMCDEWSEVDSGASVPFSWIWAQKPLKPE
ncbi:S-adenosyl-L-methionine-dependent methyltransferase [Exidia glandulosa HHB12029]|uniref:S-adenosyl-L-methionine-dependent methyltransferase n=1 Tax=Exidia glandulosa HHB12029 TaxID=1314781 RepID=A0A165BHF7_EXIGL|nr:S-adenosyl-L-methionine-dependent methyltransferase [Exidia glandulosa HHB12029]